MVLDGWDTEFHGHCVMRYQTVYGLVAQYLYECHVDLRRTCTALGAFG